MSNVPDSSLEAYVFPKVLRQYFHCLGLFSVIGLSLFSIFMLYIACTQESDNFPCYIVGLLFALFSAFMGVILISKRNIVDMKFYVDDEIVINRIEKNVTGVTLNEDVFFQKIPVQVAIGYSRMALEYIAISKSDIPVDICLSNNLYTTIEKLNAYGCVVIPADKWSLIDSD